MDKFIVGVLLFAFLLWLPLFIAAVYGWFAPIELGYKIGYTALTCAFWTPVIGAWIDANK